MTRKYTRKGTSNPRYGKTLDLDKRAALWFTNRNEALRLLTHVGLATLAFRAGYDAAARDVKRRQPIREPVSISPYSGLIRENVLTADEQRALNMGHSSNCYTRREPDGICDCMEEGEK